MKENNIRWAPIIPLVGGFPLGAEAALEKSPEAIISYNPFFWNDEEYVNYQRNVKRCDAEYVVLDDDTKSIPQLSLDLMVATPPCAGLSRLNRTNFTKENPRDLGGCQKNAWMIQSTRDALSNFSPKVLIGENAPALFTEKGKPIANQLVEVAQEFGYSVTFYKTSTAFHGIPQKRDRCFYFLWKSPTAPILEWHRREHKPLIEYLEEIDSEASLHENETDTKRSVFKENRIDKCPWFQFVAHHLGSPEEAAKALSEKEITAFVFVDRNGLAVEAAKFFKESGNPRWIHKMEHFLNKRSIGKGIWDDSIRTASTSTRAIISRNISDTVHPTKLRNFTWRELLHLMGFPSDFTLSSSKVQLWCRLISQNVPVCTARDMVLQAKSFIEGDLQMSDAKVVYQSNTSLTTEFPNGIIPGVQNSLV